MPTARSLRPDKDPSVRGHVELLPVGLVERAIDITGGQWKLLVLRSLLLNGPQRYNYLRVR